MRKTIKIYQPIWQTVSEIYQPKNNSTSQQNLNESYRRVARGTWGKIPPFKKKILLICTIFNLSKKCRPLRGHCFDNIKGFVPHLKILTTRLESKTTTKIRRVARILKLGTTLDNFKPMAANRLKFVKLD